MINSIVWNIRGIVNNTSIRRLKKLIKLHKASIIVVIEPKAPNESISNYQHKFNRKGSLYNDKGSIWIFWKEDIHVTVLSSAEQFIHVEVAHNLFASPVTMTVVYASCDNRERRVLWNQLAGYNMNSPWMVVGDFNIVASQEEKNWWLPD